MNLDCQPEIKLLSGNWLPGTLLLLLWPKKLLLGIGICVGYKLSHNGVVRNEIEDLNWWNGIQLKEQNGQSDPCFVRRDNQLLMVECETLRKIIQILNWFCECFLAPLGWEISSDQLGWLIICLASGAIIIVKVEHCSWSFSSGWRPIRYNDKLMLYHCRWWWWMGGGVLWTRVIIHDVMLGTLFFTFFDEDGGDESISGGGR